MNIYFFDSQPKHRWKKIIFLIILKLHLNLSVDFHQYQWIFKAWYSYLSTSCLYREPLAFAIHCCTFGWCWWTSILFLPLECFPVCSFVPSWRVSGVLGSLSTPPLSSAARRAGSFVITLPCHCVLRTNLLLSGSCSRQQMQFPSSPGERLPQILHGQSACVIWRL